jgi:hypothetical protein
MREEHRALPVETVAFTGESQQKFVAAVFAFYTGKAVVWVATIQIPIDHLFDIGTPEAVLL